MEKMKKINLEQIITYIKKIGKQKMDGIKYMISVIKNPITSYNAKERKYSNIKSASFLVALISGLMMLSNLIVTMVNTAHVYEFNYFTDGTYSWDWSQIKHLNYLTLLVKDYVVYALLFFAIATVFYVAFLIIKKTIKFSKVLFIATTALIPVVVATMILAPLLNIIWGVLGASIGIVGIVYSLILLYELINSKIELELENKIYFNIITFSVIGLICYYGIINMISISISNLIQ